ncbi:hypothetical protein SLEP1_g4246 [Rubroshorea leprosula]|uniref:Uncharacterized protein n=1 Tax=Rubroshorea leprosula TaxID=152421 RepID=A0AAV5HXT1_9ROSI|nr:hypothetical protein SLEP1_g4246 [Rubroshorea leprosula]
MTFKAQKSSPNLSLCDLLSFVVSLLLILLKSLKIQICLWWPRGRLFWVSDNRLSYSSVCIR